MKKVTTANGYDYYEGVKETGRRKGEMYYNLVPEGSPPPAGGYYSSNYICNIKGVPNLFKKP